MGFCYKCGTNLPDGADFCQSCGGRQDARAQGVNTNQPTTQTPSSRGKQNWAERHINWTYILVSLTGGFVLGFVLTIIGLGFLGIPATVVLIIIMTRWLLNRKGRSMWLIPLAFIPIFWLVLVSLENRKTD